MFCSKCGNKIDDDAKFCKTCGADLRIKETPESKKVVEQVNISQKVGRNPLIWILIFFVSVAILGILASVILASLNTVREKTNENTIVVTDSTTSGPAPLPTTAEISVEDINMYLPNVGQISCFDEKKSGTGFFMVYKNSVTVITNKHVIHGSTLCNFMPLDSTERMIGFYNLNLSSESEWNKYTDVARLEFSVLPKAAERSLPVLQVSDNDLSKLRVCPSRMAQGTPVVLIGYPAFAQQMVQSGGEEAVMASRQVTNGIISGFDSSKKSPIGSLPYEDYYISAKIDSGNSGGPAFAKDQDGLCLLGIATWLNVGNYETQGIVQNIRNILYEE